MCVEVPTRHTGGAQRLLPHVFVKPGGESGGIMNYVTTPMATSSVFRKLEAEAEASAKALSVLSALRNKV